MSKRPALFTTLLASALVLTTSLPSLAASNICDFHAYSDDSDPAGTNVRWQIASLGLEGVATLQQTLKPGKSIGLRGVLEGGVEVGTPCAITAIGQ